MITIDDFKKLKIVTAVIKVVEDHPNADKLYLLTVSTGAEDKVVVAGIKPFYTKEELLGKTVILLDNLEPAIIRGVQSNGMLLATKDQNTLTVLVPERPIPPGSPIS